MGLLPLIAFIVEPAKILFLNNAMNHGVFSPLAIQQVQEIGKSVFFLLEPNPGPGLGVLLAFMLYSKGAAKQSAPGAIIIHFLDVQHSPVDHIPKTANVIFTQESLVERAKKSAPSDATIIPVKNFLDRAKYDEFVNGLK